MSTSGCIDRTPESTFRAVPPSSSPTPGGKRSVKGALRKKGELVSAAKLEDSPPSAAAASTKSSKRKALADVETDENVPPGAVDSEPARPAKRARTAETTRAPTPPSPIEQEDVKPKLFSDAEAQVLRPAMRARRTYHARKGRTSSPVTGSDVGSKALFVDYDALPSPPRATTTAAASSSVRLTPPRQAKTKAAEARASEAKAAETEADRGAKRARGGKADASETMGKGVKAEKSDKAVKAEKVAKPKTEKTAKTEKSTEPEKSVKTEKAKKSTTKSKVVEKTSETRNSASRVLELDESAACAPPPRGPPRPRRLGASTIKDKAKENAKQVETKPESPSRPVRVSARAAAAAADKLRAQEEEQRDVTNDNLAEAASLDVVAEMPVSRTTYWSRFGSQPLS